MIALVTGATGFIGTRLVEHLLSSNPQNKVYALVRNPAKLNRFKSFNNLHPLKGDLLSLPSLPGDCEVVFHLAGLTKALCPADYYTVNQKGTASLLLSLLRSGLRPRFVHLSSLAAGRPSSSAEPVSEDSSPCPASPYGHSKLQAEAEVLKKKNELQVIILRAAAVYGPGDLDFLQFFQLIKRGLLLSFTRPILMSLCYVDDLVRAMLTAAQPGLKSGEIYNVADPVPRSWEEIGLESARILGRKVTTIRVPLWAARGVAECSELLSRFSKKPSTLNLSKCQDLEKLFWVADVSKIKRELDFETVWDFQKALRETLTWYQKQGWL
jgi:nucleoside-diphosphate-sugar epimerase